MQVSLCHSLKHFLISQDAIIALIIRPCHFKARFCPNSELFQFFLSKFLWQQTIEVQILKTFLALNRTVNHEIMNIEAIKRFFKLIRFHQKSP